MTITQQKILRRALEAQDSASIRSLWIRFKLLFLEWERGNYDQLVARIDHERDVAMSDRARIKDQITALRRLV